jgi:hypothetical protein
MGETMTIEERFERSYERVKKEGYVPHRFLQMVRVDGVVKTVATLLQPCGDHYRDGFTKVVYELGMPEETIEAIAFYEFPSLFTSEQLAEARRRLDVIGYAPELC